MYDAPSALEIQTTLIGNPHLSHGFEPAGIEIHRGIRSVDDPVSAARPDYLSGRPKARK